MFTSRPTPKRQRRCFCFHSDGTPIGQGCSFNSRCDYVHPGDDLWDKLPALNRDRFRDTSLKRERTKDYEAYDRDRDRRHSSDRPSSSRDYHRRQSSPGYSPSRRRPSPSSSVERERGRREQPPFSASSTVSDSAPPPPTTASSSAPPQSAMSQTPTQPRIPALPHQQTLHPLTTTDVEMSAPSSVGDRDKWVARLRLVSAWINKFADCERITEQIHRLDQINALVTDPARKQVNQNNRNKLEESLKSQQAALQETLDQVVASDDWPVGPQPGVEAIQNKSNAMLITLDSLKGHLTALNDTVVQIHREQMDELGLDGQADTETSSGIPPLKRGLISDYDPAPTSQSNPPLRYKFTELEDKMEEIRNLVDQHQATTLDEINSLLEKRLLEIEEEKTSPDSPESRWRTEMLQRIGQADQYFTDLPNRVAEAMEATTQLRKETDAVKQEQVTIKEDIVKLLQRVDNLELRQKEDSRAMDVQRAALETYSRNIQPAAPVALDKVAMKRYVDTVAIPQMQETLKTMLSELRSEVTKKLTEREEAIYGTLWQKLTLVITVVDTVCARLDVPAPPPSSSSIVNGTSSTSMGPPAVPQHFRHYNPNTMS